MNITNPVPLVIFRWSAVLILIGLIGHLLRLNDLFVLPYIVSCWLIVFALILTFLLSFLRRPLAAYLIAVIIPILPASLFTLLWLLVLKSAPVWEFLLAGFIVMLVPVTLSIQIVRNRGSRIFFRLPVVER